ncbi:MAG TPA: RluA family pseudouridine synthase [Candidatus Saccharimonadales bacterium]|nr:RluA family pseudouridine synthase [Candidatus Saccharimonadales bacterium]
MRRFKVSSTAAGQRADVFVAAKYPQFSRSALETLFDRELVRIARKPVKASRKLRTGEYVSLDDSLLTAKPEPLDMPIIYEDKDVIVINKPAGILTHSKGALNTESTVADFIKDKLNGFEDSNRAGIVHRLDRGTSGVIITAKNPASLAWLQKQFSTRKAKKIYQAMVEGVPDPAEAVIDVPIARNLKRPQTFQVNATGRAAQTQYKVLRVFRAGDKEYALLELRPRTGRTHQLRVHLAYIGHPIVGDNIYGHGGPAMLLHAKSLELTLPNRQRKVFEAPLMREMEKS